MNIWIYIAIIPYNFVNLLNTFSYNCEHTYAQIYLYKLSTLFMYLYELIEYKIIQTLSVSYIVPHIFQ